MTCTCERHQEQLLNNLWLKLLNRETTAIKNTCYKASSELRYNREPMQKFCLEIWNFYGSHRMVIEHADRTEVLVTGKRKMLS